jgi:site-specific recombinase XerD
LEYFRPDPSPVPPAIRAYLDERARTGTAPSTAYAYRRDLLDCATYLEETTERPFATSRVTTELVLEYMSYLRVRRLSARTVNRRLAALRGLLRHAQSVGFAGRPDC